MPCECGHDTHWHFTGFGACLGRANQTICLCKRFSKRWVQRKMKIIF